MSINKVIITGNLTRDAELRYSKSGSPIAAIGVAVNDRTKDASGQWIDYPNFFNCVMLGKRAESLNPYLTKGQKVAIEGKLRYSSWEDQQSGQKHSKVEIMVYDLELLGSRKNGTSQAATESSIYDDEEWD